MRVKATKTGFYNDSLRDPGDEFEVPDGLKGSWFVPVAEFKTLPTKAEEKEPNTLSQMGKQRAKGPTEGRG